MKRVILAMSGGVDSSLAAHLLLRDGWGVLGVTLDLWPEVGAAAIRDARQVADHLGIPHRVLSLHEDFARHVVDPFCHDYFNARTPNPCLHCNPQIKFASLMRVAEETGAEAIATGHYARVEKSPGGNRWLLRRAADLNKDQSYVLSRLSQSVLSKARFPLGELSKGRVREAAREIGLKVHDRPDSQEICFIPDHDYAGFLERRMPQSIRAGAIRDTHGKRLAAHGGLHHFTIGQRKGLGFAAGEPRFVVRLEPENSSVVVGSREDTLCSEFAVSGVNWIYPVVEGQKLDAVVKIRYRHRGAACKVEALADGTARVILNAPESAVTPGQGAVFYDGEYVVGGGTIERAFAEQ